MFLLKSSLSKLPGTLSVIAIPLFRQRPEFYTPNNVETTVIHAIFLLKSSLSKLPGILSSIARLILRKALSLSIEQNTCFDVGISQSTKDDK